MSASWPVREGVFDLGDLPVERGGVIRGARLSWQAHGSLGAARDNVIVYPCSYTASHGPGGARRKGGASLVCGVCTERRRASLDTAVS